MEKLESGSGDGCWFHELSRPFRLPEAFAGRPYVCALFVNDPAVTAAERAILSADLVRTGCRSALCAGHDGSLWDDAIDVAHLESVNHQVTDENLVMTTWHDDEPLADVVFHALFQTHDQPHEFRDRLFLSVGPDPTLKGRIVEAINTLANPDDS